MSDATTKVRSPARFDVVGIGNAIVDVIAHADDAFLTRNDLAKGAMTLIDAPRAETLYGKMAGASNRRAARPPIPSPGWPRSAARAAFIGKVRDDQLGGIFRHDIRAAGVAFKSTPATAVRRRRAA